MRNESSLPIIVHKSTNLGRLVEFEQQACYQVSSEEHVWAAKGDIKVEMASDEYQTILPNDPHACGSPNEVAKLRSLVEEFAVLWEDTGRTVTLPQDDWMTIPLNND